MIELLHNVAAVAAGLTAGELFPAATGVPVEIAYVVGDYPYKTDTEGAPPLGVVLLRSFSPGPATRTATVEIAYTLYGETRTEAMASIGSLSSLLEPLAERGARYTPWKLTGVTGFVGDRETGAHPDPQYFITYMLEFSGAR
jgi:hypothetical protein